LKLTSKCQGCVEPPVRIYYRPLYHNSCWLYFSESRTSILCKRRYRQSQ